MATTILLSLVCAAGEAAGPRDYILEDASEVISTNYKVQLTSDVIPLPLLGLRSLDNVGACEVAKKYGRDGERFNSEPGEIGRVERVISVSAGGGTYSLIIGDLATFKITLLEW